MLVVNDTLTCLGSRSRARAVASKSEEITGLTPKARRPGGAVAMGRGSAPGPNGRRKAGDVEREAIVSNRDTPDDTRNGSGFSRLLTRSLDVCHGADNNDPCPRTKI